MLSVPIPTIIERTPRGERAWDLFSRLLQERVVLLGTPIDSDDASSIVAQLLFLQHSDPERDIWFYINSPGGSVRDGLAIYDTMQLIRPDVATTCVGMAASMGAVLLAGGSKGKRYALPNSRVLLHQASGGFQGFAADIDVQAREILRLQARMTELIASDTRQTTERIERDLNRDFWMSAREAMDYGVVDLVIGQTPATAAADQAEERLGKA
jgi:ATP-dependent Clp protease, protease subunit